jgi:hypothetical protein
VQSDACFAFGVPADTALGNQAEQVVRSERRVAGPLEMIGGRIALEVSQRGPVLARERLVHAVRERLEHEERMGRAAASQVDLEGVRPPLILPSDGDEVDGAAPDHAFAGEAPTDLQTLARD